MSSFGPGIGQCVALWVALGISAAARGQWVQPPTPADFERVSGLSHHVLHSEVMHTDVGYCVVLPPGYDTSDQRYPVVYWLHGGGGNESSTLFTAQTWREREAGKQIQPVILVYPNGFRSGYMDHFDGSVMIESLIITELIPLIDSDYRTIASKEGRAVHGFSMGSSGALKFAFKYPDLFCSAVAYGGGSIDLEKSTDPFITTILQRNLNSDPELIRANNTFRYLKQNHERVRNNGTQFLLITGEEDSWKESAVTFQAALQARMLPCRLTLVPGVAHNLSELISAEGHAAARFQDEVFRQSLNGDTSQGTEQK